MPNTYQVKLHKKCEISRQLYSFQIDKPFDFKGGQFVAVLVAEKVKRFYSIASAPYEDYIEFLVNTDPGGPGSQYFEKLQIGDKLEIMGPMGAFTFKSTGDTVFICTGTGLAPCIAMIKAQLHPGYKNGIHLLFGTRYDTHILKEDELTELTRQYPNFSFNLSVTRPTENWQVIDSEQIKKSTGRVTEHLEQIDPNADYYICGVKDMLESVKAKLLENNVPKERIYFEQY